MFVNRQEKIVTILAKSNMSNLKLSKALHVCDRLLETLMLIFKKYYNR